MGCLLHVSELGVIGQELMGTAVNSVLIGGKVEVLTTTGFSFGGLEHPEIQHIFIL